MFIPHPPPISKFLIYSLHDPRTGQRRYIGQSSTGLQRPKSHFHPSSARTQNPHFRNWISNLRNAGIAYTIEVVAQLPSAEELDDAEIFWIAIFRSQGCDLLNYSDGGGAAGLAGKPLSPEHKAALRIGWEKRKKKGLLRSRASYEAQGAKTRGRKQSPEWVAKRVKKLKGRTLLESQKQQISKTLEGRPASEGTARNLRKMAAERSAELTVWIGRKGAAKRWGKEFNEPRPSS